MSAAVRRALLALVALLALALAPACASRGVHTRPEDMSAEAHRNEAAHHLEAARIAEERIEERDHDALTTRPANDAPGALFSYAWDTERWTQEQEGEQHLAAAQALEREYAFACALIAPADQQVSPLDRYLDGVTRIDGRGVRLHLVAAAGPAPGLLHRLRCHRARMAYLGLDEMRDCPLGVRGLRVEVHAVADGLEVTLVPRDPGTLADLERRARLTLARAQERR